MLGLSRSGIVVQRTALKPFLLKNTLTRRFLINEPKYDEAEILAKGINNKEFKTRRSGPILNNGRDTVQPSNEVTLQRIKKLQNGSLLFLSLLGVTLGVSYYIYDRNDKLNRLKDEEEWAQISSGSIKKSRKKSRKKKKTVSKPIVPLDQLDSTHPGLYVWGSLTNDTEWNDIPKRIPLFDNMLLRDVCLIDKTKNLVLTDNGDLLNWDSTNPEILDPILRGQNLIKIKESNNVLYGLSQTGEILVIPLKDMAIIQDQYVTSKKRIGILPRIPKINSYNSYSLKLDTRSLFDSRLNEKKIIDFDTGSTHLVFLSDAAKVYSCATGYAESKAQVSRGQFGIPTLSQYSKYPNLNEPYEVELLNKAIVNNLVEFRKIKQIACGDYHTIAIDSLGNLFTFGWNRFGQLGFNISYENEVVPYPKQIPINIFIPFFNESTNDGGNVPILSKFNLECVDIGCCKETTYVTIKNSLNECKYFSMGNGLNGELGDGSYRNSQYQPTRVKFEGLVQKWISNKDANHVVSEMKDGSIDSWGLNDRGQLGSWQSKKVKINKPMGIPLLIEPGVTYDEETKIETLPRLHIDLTKQNISVGKDSTCIYWKSSK
ncbi:hypothetical protein C6P45_004895 [Maudiozyma exigua]|uniref:Protein FMP25, mitochondrial n=1 Tax=Maudiozyma exigua TaxID=34358 RepID=A0A9P6WBC4_MAUEX|nr:hypothetical protein C6P45_004895 [Kazachstania exigua]